MTREEAIRYLNEKSFQDYSCTPYIIAIEDMEKQLKKKPIIWENKSYDAPVPNDDWGYECPCCGNQEIDYPEHHCTCGQALDWNNINI